MKYEPDCRKHLTGNGNLHLHFVLSPDNGLDVAELVVEASLRFAGCPRAFDESFPQVFVSVRYASRLDLSRTFLITR